MPFCYNENGEISFATRRNKHRGSRTPKILQVICFFNFSMDKIKVLIAEDDRDIVEVLKLYIESNDMNVTAARDGEKALELAKKEEFSVALVDIMMPKLNGYELIKEIRKTSNLPIIIISAKSADSDKVLGLDIGADAYITKPFNPLEVVAYIKAVVRRNNFSKAKTPQTDSKQVIRVKELILNLQEGSLTKNGKIIPVTSAEIKILKKLMMNPNRIYTKAQLYKCINDEYFCNDENTIMVHISNIRSKIEDDPAKPKFIKTVRGLGYKIEE